MERGGAATMRENRGTIAESEALTSAYTVAATIGPTSHATGTPARSVRGVLPAGG